MNREFMKSFYRRYYDDPQSEAVKDSELYKEKKGIRYEVEEKLEKVQLENERLNKEKEKLQDPDYVQSYARGNYMLSKDGEQIFYLPESNSGD